MSFTLIKKAYFSSISKEKIASVLSIIIGSALVLFIGFSHIPEVHNAAHDTRHSASFPCH